MTRDLLVEKRNAWIQLYNPSVIQCYPTVDGDLAMFAVWIFLLAASTVTALQCPAPPSTEATLSRWPYITASAPATATITFGTAEHSFGKGSITWSDGRVWTTVSAESKTLTWYNWDDLPPVSR